MTALSRRRVVALVAASVFVSSAAPLLWAQDWAQTALDKSPRHREYVDVKTAGGRTVSTYVVYPEVAGKAPVVLLIHEIFGLTPWAKLMADELAAKGYIVVAPDLLSGMNPGTTPASAMGMGGMHVDAATASGHAPTAASGTDSFPTVDAVTKAVSSLPAEQVLGDLDAVADYAGRIPSGTGVLSVAGFCWGGGKTFAFATHRAGLKGSYVFYGPAPDAAAMKGISAPVYGFYAGNDARITASLPETVAAMKAAGKSFAPVTYAGAGHGFMRAGQQPEATAENQKAWQDGFARLTGLLGGQR